MRATASLFPNIPGVFKLKWCQQRFQTLQCWRLEVLWTAGLDVAAGIHFKTNTISVDVALERL